MAALSNKASPSEQKSQSLIGKVSASLQLLLKLPVSIKTVSVLRQDKLHKVDSYTDKIKRKYDLNFSEGSQFPSKIHSYKLWLYRDLFKICDDLCD